jgi:AAHS family 4-hydroxybenzoate transporter-like MFS transporter
MTGPPQVDLGALVERSRLGRFQVTLFAVLGACLVMDGFDVQAMGFVAPAIIQAWGVPKAELAPVFGAGLLGLFLGSLLSGMVADRLGRRPVLLVATAAFGLFSLLTAAAGSLAALLAARFLAGLGLGAIMPNATALIGEYSPRRRRIATMMIVTNGFMVGAMLGGFLSAWLIPAFGWQAVFLVGGAVPLLLLLPMAAAVPESLQFLAVRRQDPARIARWVRRLDPSAPSGPDVRYLLAEEGVGGVPLLQLFRGGRAAGTALLWTANFMNVLVAYFVASWLPTVTREAGHSTTTAVLVGTAVQAGGAIGTVVLGLIMQRTGFVAALAVCFAGAAVNLALLGQPWLPLWLLVVVAFLAGWGIFGGQPGLNALAATAYPTELRSSGLGAALGVGRFGAILGPLLAGGLMARHWSTEALFYASAAPAVISTLVVLAMGRVLGVDGRRPGSVAPPGLTRPPGPPAAPARPARPPPAPGSGAAGPGGGSGSA